MTPTPATVVNQHFQANPPDDVDVPSPYSPGAA